MDGLDKFREAFAAYSDNYVIIGGTACSIAMADTAIRARATHDIDMVIIVENMTAEFANRFWEFIRQAGYRPEKRQVNDDGRPKYEMYRFVDAKDGYPQMIELLSRHPDALGTPKGLRIEPIPTTDEMSSLSAIIMDDVYYHFTIEHSQLTNNIRHADSAALIALKARAYLNLLADKKAGKAVNTKDIKKHRSDVFRNVLILTEDNIIAPKPIAECIIEFVDSIKNDWPSVGSSLAMSLNQDESFVEKVLEQLAHLFVTAR